MLTTLQTKHAMCTLTNAMLREHRLSLSRGDYFVSKDEIGLKRLLREVYISSINPKPVSIQLKNEAICY